MLHRGRGWTLDRAAVPVLTLMTVVGWGAFGYAAFTSADIEEELQKQAAALSDFQTQYMTQQKMAEKTVKENASLRERLTASRAEIQSLSVRNKEIDAELASARNRAAAALQNGLPHGIGSSPELMAIKPRPTKQDVIAAQEALTQLRFGNLKPNGVIDASTRQAVEEFQRTVGLPVTGELQAQTLLALVRSAKVMAAQGEKAAGSL
nr:peptidoglycan-binding domain-containing protein [Microvirga sp. ACRRW]